MYRYDKLETARTFAKELERRGYETFIEKQMRNRKPSYVLTVRRVA
jgi:hypothetical protein